ncbi:MAG: killer suppression protein [Desulfobacterales bacterium]
MTVSAHMDILFKNAKDRDLANSDTALRKKYLGNTRRCKLIRARLDELADAKTLVVMRTIPQADCHQLKSNREGQLAVKLDRGYRMVFEVADDPVPQKTDGGLDWSKVTAIRIIKLAEDYHE